MLNHNAFKTSLIFLVIVSLSILAYYFLAKNNIIDSSLTEKVSEIICSIGVLCH